MKITHAVIKHSAGDFRIPVIDRSEDREDGRYRHHHVEVRHDEIGIGERHVDDHVTEKDASQPAIDKRENETNGKQHGNRETDISAPQSEHPVVDLDGGRHCDDQCRRRKEEPEVGIHTTHVHVMRPNDETQAPNDDYCPNHQPVTKDVFPGVDADQFGDNSECRQRHDINLGMAKEPEQMLEQYRAPA